MKHTIFQSKKSILTFIVLLFVFICLSASQIMQWKPLAMPKAPVNKKGKIIPINGTNRVLTEGKSKVLYYRSLPGKPLDLGTTNQSKLRISVFSKKDTLKLKYTVIIDKEKKDYVVHYQRKVGTYFCYGDVYLTLTPGQHKVQINTANRTVYFRAFYQHFKKVYPPISLAKPATAADTIHLNKGTTAKTYYVATFDKPYQFVVDDKHTVYGYARATWMTKSASSFEIYRNGTLLQKIDISAKKTKLYNNPKFQNVSIGKKFSIPLVAGKNVIVLKPIGANPVIFRIFKERKITK